MDEEDGVRLRDRQPNPIRELEPRLLAHRVGRVDELVDAALALELVVDHGGQRDRDAVRGSDGEAFLPVAFNEHVGRAELVPCNTEPALRELLEVAGLERLPHGAELVPQARPEHA